MLLTLICFVPVFSQDNNCASLQKLIDRTYNFKPSKLTSEEQTAKSVEMDVVWNKVKSDKENLLPCLKMAMEKTDANNFFIFNASNLIISLDQSDESKKTLIRSYGKVDLEDVNLAYWLPYIAVLGFEGFDTTEAGENWLRSSIDGYYLPQHGTKKLTKDIGSLIIYGSMDEKIATPALAKIAFDEKHPGRLSAIYLLFQQATPDASKVLENLKSKNLSADLKTIIAETIESPRVIKTREGEPKTSREQYLEALQELVNGKPQKFMKITIEVADGEKDVVAVMKQEDIPLIRKARRFFAATANPHSAEWYQSFTDILTTLINRK